jgi:hypothetical protein
VNDALSVDLYPQNERRMCRELRARAAHAFKLRHGAVVCSRSLALGGDLVTYAAVCEVRFLCVGPGADLVFDFEDLDVRKLGVGQHRRVARAEAVLGNDLPASGA